MDFPFYENISIPQSRQTNRQTDDNKPHFIADIKMPETTQRKEKEKTSAL